jgi:hypothetical protein
MVTIPSADRTARLILKALVYRLNLRPGVAHHINAVKPAAQEEGMQSRAGSSFSLPKVFGSAHLSSAWATMP